MGFSTRRSSSSVEKDKVAASDLGNKDAEGGFVSTGPDDVEQNAVPGTAEVDAVFGAQDGEGPNYRSVGWISTSILLMKVSHSRKYRARAPRLTAFCAPVPNRTRCTLDPFDVLDARTGARNHHSLHHRRHDRERINADTFLVLPTFELKPLVRRL